jgi:hypothetical protein
MSLDQELSAFYSQHGFGETLGSRTLTVPVYTGCMLVPLPNIETRHIYLKYHDLHHMITGYSVGRIGEGEMSSWELGTGSFFKNPLLGIMNFIALSTGLFLEPQRMWKAFIRGCISRNLYSRKERDDIDAGKWNSINEVKPDFLEIKEFSFPVSIRFIEFVFYSTISIFIHALIVIPAIIARFITDVTLKKSFFQAVKPTKRTDLY